MQATQLKIYSLASPASLPKNECPRYSNTRQNDQVQKKDSWLTLQIEEALRDKAQGEMGHWTRGQPWTPTREKVEEDKKLGRRNCAELLQIPFYNVKEYYICPSFLSCYRLIFAVISNFSLRLEVRSKASSSMSHFESFVSLRRAWARLLLPQQCRARLHPSSWVGFFLFCMRLELRERGEELFIYSPDEIPFSPSGGVSPVWVSFSVSRFTEIKPYLKNSFHETIKWNKYCSLLFAWSGSAIWYRV